MRRSILSIYLSLLWFNISDFFLPLRRRLGTWFLIVFHLCRQFFKTLPINADLFILQILLYSASDFFFFGFDDLGCWVIFNFMLFNLAIESSPVFIYFVTQLFKALRLFRFDYDAGNLSPRIILIKSCIWILRLMPQLVHYFFLGFNCFKFHECFKHVVIHEQLL